MKNSKCKAEVLWKSGLCCPGNIKHSSSASALTWGGGKVKPSGLFYRNQTLTKELLDSLTFIESVEGNEAFDV